MLKYDPSKFKSIFEKNFKTNFKKKQTAATCIMLSSGLVLSGLSMQYIPPQRYGQGGGLQGQGIATASDLLPLPEEVADSAGSGGKAGGNAAALFHLQNKHFGRIRSALLDIESEEDEEAFQAEAGKLNLAYFYAEGADDSDVLNSYAGEVYRNLMNKDSQYIANLFEFSGVLPVDMARRLGLPSSAVLGKYNPDEKGQSKDNPSTWLVPNFRRVNINFYNADGALMDEYSNVKEIMAMASVYCYRHDFLDSETFEKICNALYEESHAYQISIGDVYYDSGCIHRSAKEEGEEEEKEEAEEEAKKEKEKEQEKEKEKEKAGAESDGIARTDSSGTASSDARATGGRQTGQDLADGSSESRTGADGAADSGRNDSGTASSGENASKTAVSEAGSSGTDASGQRRVAGGSGSSSDGERASANGGASANSGTSASSDTAQEGENGSSRIMTDEEGNPLNTTIINGETYVMVYGHADRDGKRAMHLIPLDEYEREHGKTGLGNGGPGTAMPEADAQEDAQGAATGTGGAEAGETEIGATGSAAASDAAKEDAGASVAAQESTTAVGEGSSANHGASETAGNAGSSAYAGSSEAAGSSASAESAGASETAEAAMASVNAKSSITARSSETVESAGSSVASESASSSANAGSSETATTGASATAGASETAGASASAGVSAIAGSSADAANAAEALPSETAGDAAAESASLHIGNAGAETSAESHADAADAGNMENAIEADADAMGASADETAAASGAAETQEAGIRRTSSAENAAGSASAARLGNVSITFYAEAAVSEAEEGAGQEDAISAETPPLMISAAVSESGSSAAGNADAGSGVAETAEAESSAAGNTQTESSISGNASAESGAADAASKGSTGAGNAGISGSERFLQESTQETSQATVQETSQAAMQETLQAAMQESPQEPAGGAELAQSGEPGAGASGNSSRTAGDSAEDARTESNAAGDADAESGTADGKGGSPSADARGESGSAESQAGSGAESVQDVRRLGGTESRSDESGAKAAYIAGTGGSEGEKEAQTAGDKEQEAETEETEKAETTEQTEKDTDQDKSAAESGKAESESVNPDKSEQDKAKADASESETGKADDEKEDEDAPDDPNDKNYCPGHVDLFVRVRMSGFDDAKGLRSIDLSRIAGLSAEEDSAWEGWTEENIAAVHQMVSQDWFKTYGLSISSLNPKTPLTSEEISMYLSKLPASVSTERRKVVEYALSSVGKIPYYWGGKASRPGYEGNGFGTVTEADHRGRILRGLDCSGWIQWVYWSAIGNSLDRVYSTSSLVGIGEKIHRADLQPGDIIIRTGDESHVVMFLEWTGNGNMIAIHENASSNNVSVNEVTANFPYYRRLIQ